MSKTRSLSLNNWRDNAIAWKHLALAAKGALYTAEQALGSMGGGEAAHAVRHTIQAFNRDFNRQHGELDTALRAQSGGSAVRPPETR